MAEDNNIAESVVSAAGNEVVQGVKDDVGGLSQMAGMAKNALGFLKEDVKNGIDWLKMSPEEKAQQKQEEKEAEEAKKAEEEAAAEAEAQRLEDLKKTYILHTAVILCDKAQHESFVVLPTSHGEFIHGIPQLNVADSKPNINIRSFGICRSPTNPLVKEKAKEILKDVNENREKGFMDKVLDLFTKKSDDVCTDSDENLAQYCAAECTPVINMEWIDGKEDVLIDGKPALLGRCKLTCSQGDGTITIYTSGQMEE